MIEGFTSREALSLDQHVINALLLCEMCQLCPINLCFGLCLPVLVDMH